MPNHIQNVLLVKSSTREELDFFLNSIKGNNTCDSCEQVIDFETIIPMPSILKDTESSSRINEAVYYYLMKTNRNDWVKKVLTYDFYKMEKFETKSEEELNEMYELGKKYFKNFEECGDINWYEWRCNNWGTKWNAYESCMSEPTDDSVTIYFQTAWSGVPKLVEILVERFPNLLFTYKFSDEDRGYNCGEGFGENGEFNFDYYNDASDYAMELYKECWGFDDDDFYKGEDGKWHYKDWDDEVEE